MASFFKKWVFKALSNSGLLRVNFMFSSAKLSQKALAAVKVALGSIHDTGSPGFNARARMCKLLRNPGIDSKESIPPAYVTWRAFTTTLFVVLTRHPG
jgi:hypothetical protein